MNESEQIAIKIDGVGKVYGAGTTAFTALRDVSLDIKDNEFFTLLGPSGCGKTTLLRCIAGFETVTSGSLSLFGKEIAELPPEKRPINTVFQHYSLFPHMSVLENVAFGLLRQGKSKAEAMNVAREMLELVHLDDFAARKPTQLSGGQQQRVALARALAPHPRVLLLDEPLSALDLKLRQSMRSELKRLQRETGITFVFVTHDQEEALAMSDRIAVMSAGKVQQIARPTEIYEYPSNRFVAEFIGEANMIKAIAKAQDKGVWSFEIGEALSLSAATEQQIKPGETVTLMLRPEKARLIPGEAETGFGGKITEAVYLGETTDYTIEMRGGGQLTIRAENHKDGRLIADIGQPVQVEIDPDALRVLCA